MDLELDGNVKRVTLGKGDVHEALSVIFASGSAYRKLGLPDEKRLSGHGVSWCATSDGFFFRDKTIAVVGGGETALDLQELFITIGADPRTHLVHGKLDLNADGSIAVQGRGSRTSVTGVFVAGDVLDPTYRQAVTAAGFGTVTALDAEHYLASLPTTVLAQAVTATMPAQNIGDKDGAINDRPGNRHTDRPLRRRDCHSRRI